MAGYLMEEYIKAFYTLIITMLNSNILEKLEAICKMVRICINCFQIFYLGGEL